MRFVVLGVMLAFSTPASDARTDDDPSELARKVEECLEQNRNDYHGCAKEIKACTERSSLESNKDVQLKKGMTYEEVLNVMGRQPDLVDSITYGNGTVAKIYGWYSFKKTHFMSASFINGRLSERGGYIADSFDPERPPGWQCG